ncbi:MAG: SpoIID/LytB domain-containing protein [Candidatus Levybacteria bacterium]|nr:SpoIID/LytB domain-containing protein [Candidatus Levybacteria bacterium]
MQFLKHKYLHTLFILFMSISLVLLSAQLFHKTAHSDELDELNKQIADLQSALSMSQNATKPLESQLTGLKKQLTNIDAQVGNIETDIAKKKKDIEKGYENLSDRQVIFNHTVRNSYIKNYGFNPLIIFLSGNGADDMTKLITYHQRYTERDKNTITTIALQIVDLEQRRDRLEKEQNRLASAKITLDTQRGEVQKVVDGAKAYQSDLTGKIATLTAKQNEIINARSGGFTATIGDSNLADDPNASITGFRSSAPSGYFAAFSFGAHTHRKGMSQYGARGRAQSGQDFKTILKAYYGKDPVGKETGGTIKVAGQGEIDFEGRYLLGIAEMPSSWHPEALKAQAVAARTYAYRYKQEGKEICTSEACQVFNSGKADNPPSEWRQAVESTRGQILEDVVTYYASTHGGFASPIGWDTTNSSGGSNFTENAYDKIGGSPWLYKAWYTQAYSPSSNKCGRSNPWLSPEEMADIVNAAIALKTSGIDTGRITPVTTSCWGGNPYSMDELRNLVAGSGGISSANSVSVSQGNGSTSNVTINGVSLSGEDFKRAFNLRAPGYLSIPQSGFAFFNIEKK